MNNEYEPWPTADINTLLSRRIETRPSGVSPTLDPYNLMVQRKQSETKEVDPKTVQKWPEQDVKALEEYCSKMGIAGFSSGKIPPSVALAMLKRQLGDDFTNVPLEERIPAGYEKCGTPSTYGPNYPYSQAMQKKQILHG
jgi:hypothetical protein